MPDYQAVPRPGDMQFGDPLDFSDPTGSLAASMAAVTLQRAGLPIPPQIAAALRGSTVSAIHPDVHEALIQAERRGGSGPALLGKTWGQTMAGGD
jgi:hypothetical protein